jgi:3-oxoacyl-[acyl-carrier-protein] synthase-3
MQGQQVKEYYRCGIRLLYDEIRTQRQMLFKEVRRLYTHQPSRALIEDFVETARLPREKVRTNARSLGNLVSPCTIKLLDDDIATGEVSSGDEVAFLVVGAGPERGAFTARVRLHEHQAGSQEPSQGG